MTSKKKKILFVIIPTLLIWTWAYDAKEETRAFTATLTVSKAIDRMLVTVDQQQQIEMHLAITGPAAKVNDLKDSLGKGEKSLDFVFNPKELGINKPGSEMINLLEDFFRDSDKMKSLRLNVTSCIPKEVNVVIEALVEKQLAVHCYAENDTPIKHENINPPYVTMFVPQSWTGEVLEAKVRLSPQQIANARKNAIIQQPYIELIPGSPIFADEVKIKLPSTQTPLLDQVLSGADLAIGYIFSAQTEGKYIVQLRNESELIESLQFSATETAFNAYKSQTYKILIEVVDADITETEDITREVLYNFPHKYIATGEIELTGEPRSARFKLIEVTKQPAEN